MSKGTENHIKRDLSVSKDSALSYRPFQRRGDSKWGETGDEQETMEERRR